MRKNLFSLVVALSTSLISACSSGLSDLQVQPNIGTQGNVSAMSDKGLNSLYDLMLTQLFYSMDKNHDGIVTFVEYKLASEPATPIGPPVPGTSYPEPSAYAEMSASQIVAKTKQDNIPTDPAEKFAKMDKNRDNKLTLNEVKAKSNYFIPLNSKDVIRIYIKEYFGMIDTNINKYVSLPEFLKAPTHETQILLSQIFYTADVNKDDLLSFSEFEDLQYSAIKGYISTPATIVSPVPGTAPVTSSPEPTSDFYGTP